MRNSLYYQALEQDDSVRSDPFDGSLPIEGVVDIPFMKSKDSLIHEPRVMTGNTFIKCFYNYSDRDCKKISQEEYSLTISDDSMSELITFKQDHALIIVDPVRYLDQIEQACQKQKASLYYSNVEYLDREELGLRTNELVCAVEHDQPVKHPSFYKNKRFSKQQEFRLCISYPYINISTRLTEQGQEYFILDRSVADETYTIYVDSIMGISFIIPLAQLIQRPIIARVVGNQIHFSSEVKA